MIILIPIKVKILKFYLKLLVRYRNINTNDTRKQSSRKHGHMSQGTLEILRIFLFLQCISYYKCQKCPDTK